MKILFGMPSKDSWGGPISSEPPFIDAVRKAGIDVVEEDYVFGDKATPTSLGQRVKRVLRTAFRFRSLVRSDDFDVIHLNTAFDKRTLLRDTFSIFLMRPGGAKVFLKLHGTEAHLFSQANWFYRFLLSYLNRRVDGFGVHSEAEIREFKALGFDVSKFHAVKNTVELKGHPGARETRRKSAKDNGLELLFVSRFIRAKGLLETIEACKFLRDDGISFSLYCLGDGEIKDAAEKLVVDLELGEHVVFTGYIPESEVEGHLFERDILIFPTQLAEGFPNVLFKAIAAGMSVVTTKTRAAVEYLEEGQNCLFCTTEPVDIAHKIKLLFEDESLRRRIEKNNIRFGEQLSADRVAAEFIAIYEKLAQR